LTRKYFLKAKLIYDSWGKECDKVFFITKFTNEHPNASVEITSPVPVLEPAGLLNDTYDELTTKMFVLFRDLFLRYNTYDWYLKADTDTFIFVENLRSFLSDKNSSAPVTFGYDFKVIVDKGYHSGGGGYVLSNEAMTRLGSKLNSNFTYCKNTGTEDVDVANCLRRLDVYPEKSIDNQGRERFHPLSVSDHLTGYYPDWLNSYASNPLKKVSRFLKICTGTSRTFFVDCDQEFDQSY
jgi:glycoprotein-N-acetylgalactosamine 3-beta-galactosyltransferase